VTLGRHESNLLSFPNNVRLSRHHLVLQRSGDSWSVRDLETKNGTLVNGLPIHGECPLQPGDLITAGSLLIGFDAEPIEAVEAELTLDEVLTGEFSTLGENPPTIGLLVHACRELIRASTPDWHKPILASVMQTLKADRGALMVLEGTELIPYASYGADLQLSNIIREKVIGERISLLVRDLGMDTHLSQADSLLIQNVRSLIAVPLQTKNNVHGLIYADRLEASRFTVEHLNLLTVLAHIAATRIEEDGLRERERLHREENERLAQLAEARSRALEAAEMVRYAESRAVLAETATSMGRLAAAVSHELNTPLGVIKSSVQTLARTIEKSRSGDDVTRLLPIMEELSRSIVTSAERLSDVVLRLQRITNLDRAELQEIRLGDLLMDIVQLTLPDVERKIVWEVQDLPKVLSRPQYLSVVFSSLLQHCHPGEVRIRANVAGDCLQVRIEQPHCFLAESDLLELFEPSFRVVGGNVRTANWGLFTARHVMRELGGDVSAASDARTGTTFVVVIPFASP